MTPEELLIHREFQLLRAAGKIRKHGKRNSIERVETRIRSAQYAQAIHKAKKEVKRNVMTIKAKFKVESVLKTEYGEKVTMKPVYSSDSNSENYSFSQATPTGEIMLGITNAGAFGALEVGKEYIIDFTPAG